MQFLYEKELKQYLELSESALAEAYDCLVGRETYPDAYKAEQMRSILKEETKPCFSIWSFKCCLDYLEYAVKEVG